MSKRKRFAKSPPFIMLPRWVTQSAAWRALMPPERAVYLELRERFNGRNNGSIGLGCREAAEAVNVGRDTASRAFARLEELGFIEAAVKSSFRTNGRRATEWLLTELPDDRTGHKAVKTFASWRSEKTEPSPISRQVSPTSRTQTAENVAKMWLRPTSRTQTPIRAELASDLKDTYRYTIPPAAAEARPAKEAGPHKAGERRSGRAHHSVPVTSALVQSRLVSGMAEKGK